MKTTALPEDHKTKVIVRQEADYEAVGADGRRTIPLPFDLSCVNEEELLERGLVPAGVVRGMNQLFVENIGNIYGAKVRAAVSKKEDLPGEEDMAALIESYDFSGVRASSEAGMPEEERTFRTHLKKQLRNLLRGGTFSSDGSPLTVQTAKEAATDTLPEGKISIEDFDVLVEAAAEGAEFQYEGMGFNFEGEPVFDAEGNFGNFAAIPAFAKQLADQEMALRRAATGKGLSPSMPTE